MTHVTIFTVGLALAAAASPRLRARLLRLKGRLTPPNGPVAAN